LPTVFLSYENNISTNAFLRSKSEYYLKLIIKQTMECLNSNCISYVAHKNSNPKNEIDANIILSTAGNQKLLPYNQNGIQIFFTPGNPKSKRLAEIMAENLKNIYYSPLGITIHPKEKNQSNGGSLVGTYVYMRLGNEKSKKDMLWLKENTEEISQNIIMSLTEYFGLPFAPCMRPLKGIAKLDSNIFSKPSKKSKIIGYIAKNKKTQISGQWEDWYIIGQNHNLGYVPSKFIDII